MKKNNLLSLLFGLLLMANSGIVSAQTARMQIIHNSADAAAEVVDVWLNNTKLIENFAFRTATPYIDAPAGVLLNIGIAPPNSTSWTQSFRIKQVVLTENETYVVVAGGIISTSGYTPSPLFKVDAYPIGREAASQAGNTDILVVHGSTDAPTVDIYETGVGAGEIVNDLMYGHVAGYLELPTMNYVLEIRDETGMNTLAAYDASLVTLGLEGSAITVVASGFLNPANNSDGEAFGLYVALADGGELVELPLYTGPSARLQVIHNSADAAAAVVDVWANNVKLLENFEFRTATPFIDVSAETPITISITGPGSTSPSPAVFTADVTFEDGETYVVVANGIVSGSGYNPATPFNLYVYAMGREEASMAGNTDVLVHHGSTDTPAVQIWLTGEGAGSIFSFGYGEFNEYLELPTNDYTIEIREENGFTILATYQAPLGLLGLEGQALTVIASGFATPENNSNGEPFGLYVALASGGDLVELPLVTSPTARVQVIHNSADLLAQVVDVWANDAKLLENFSFRTATPFVDVPAETPIVFAITNPGSTGPLPNLFQTLVTFAADETYVVVANGIVSVSGYEPSEPFGLNVYDMGREEATMTGNTDVLAFHGSTDAPTVSVWETGVGAGELFTFSYGDFAGYLELGTADYVLEVRTADGETTVVAYSAPLSTLGLDGAALTVVASGFLNPANNSNGDAFGLFVALASGGDLIALPVYVAPDPTARIQIIHNSADAAVAEVDIYVNGDLFLEGFGFREATPFVDVPAGVDLNIIVAPAGAGIANGVGPVTVNLTEGETYIAIANGIVSASGYDPAAAFSLDVFPTGREAATEATNTDVVVFHGSTDVPTVSVWETGVGAGELFTFSYGDFAGYLELGTADYVLEVRTADGETTVVAYSAPLSTLGLDGAAITVVASGFLNPANNSNGEAFGLYVALAAGGDLIALPVYEPTARIQIIHNSADATVEEVDIFVNGDLFLSDFAFRTATPFVSVPAGVDLGIIVAPAGAGIANGVGPVTVNLTEGETYIAIANGIVSATGYDPATAFSLNIFAAGREAATEATNTDVLVFHGSTDAPTVSVWETGVGASELFTFSYGEFAGYLELATADYVLEVRTADGETTVVAYSAPLATLGLDGAALTLVASGFLNPANNSNGEAFGLYVALAAGGDLIALPVYTETFEVTFNVDMTYAENFDPANDVVYITGSIFGWAEPGTQPENQTMIRVDDSMIWTKTANLAAGEYAYKYFLNAGWNGGEWQGGDDRFVAVEGDMVINDWFGYRTDPTSVNDLRPQAQLNLYPNPARQMLNIVSDQEIREVRMLDMLGKVVYVADVKNERYVMNVNGFNNGIYFMQVLTQGGVTTQRVQISN